MRHLFPRCRLGSAIYVSTLLIGVVGAGRATAADSFLPAGDGWQTYANERFGTRLVLIMGHTHCGAIDAAIEAVSHANGPASRNLESIVNRVRPSIEQLVATHTGDREALRREAMRANVRASVKNLRHGSDIIERLAAHDGLLIVGAELDLTTGEVALLD